MKYCNPFHLSTAAGGFLAAAILGGCDARHPLRDDPWAAWPTQDARLVEQRDRLRREVAAPPMREVGRAALDDIPADADVDDYVAWALRRHPGLLASRQRVARMAERVPQLTSLPDPMFQVAPVGEMAETAAGQVGLMTGISQRFPAAGKLDTAGRIAAQEVAVAATEYRRARLAVEADTRRAFWSYYFAARALEVTGANQALLKQFHQTAEAKFRAGQATQQDVLRASVELSNLDNQLITLGQQQATAAAMLNSLLDRPVDAPLPEPKPAALQTLEWSLDRLLGEAERHNPEMRIVRERIEAFRRRVELAKLNRHPDLTVSVNYNAVEDEGLSGAANGDDQWWLGFGVNLPIWVERLDAAEREARRGVLEQLAALRSTKNTIAFRVHDAFVRVETQQRQVVLFRDVIVPQARQAVDAALSGYQAGKVDFLTLVDNWRKLLDFELMYHRNLTQLEQDHASLRQLVGDPAGRADEAPDEAVPSRSGEIQP